MIPRPGEGEPDSVWATVAFPTAPAALADFLTDTERLFRLHPHLEIELWHTDNNGTPLLAARNEVTGAVVRTTVRRLAGDPPDGFTLLYDSGLKQESVFRIGQHDGGSCLTVTERYPPPDGKHDPRHAEVDTTLTSWLLALRRHWIGRHRWGQVPAWVWWNERFLPGMVPRQRRIVRLLVWISTIEFLIFAVAAGISRLAG